LVGLSLTACTPYQKLLGYQIKENEMEACSTRETNEKLMQYFGLKT